MKNLLYYISICLVFVSCDSFLDEPPTKSSAKNLETLEELDAIFNGLTYSYSSDPDFFCTDNFEIPLETYNELPNVFNVVIPQQYSFASFNNSPSDRAWNEHYKTIWNCNLAIQVISDGSVTGSETLKNELKAEAHFIRAMEYFALALNYCLHPSEANMNEPGLPLRTGLDFEESLSRATLQETYELIETDLAEALKIDVEFDRNWRASTAAVNAFAARYYLYLGDFSKASDYANKALNEYSEMVNYASELYTIVDDGLEYPMTNNFNTNTSAWLNFWKGQYINRSIMNGTWKTLPSQELLNLYDSKDKRYEMFVVENYMQSFGLVENPYFGYIQGGNLGEYISGPSTSEMFLIRAETKARSGDIAGAMEDVEKVRINRFATEDYLAIEVPADKKSAIQTVIEERRREMPFSIRWYDIRRLNVDSETENIVITRKFYPVNELDVEIEAGIIDYVIEPDSRLYARPLSSDVINLSNGQTKQNEY